MSGPRDRPDPPSFEIPDLEVPLPEPRRSSSTLRAVTGPDSGAVPTSAKPRALPSPSLDDDDGYGELPNLDLELTGPISRDTVSNSFSSGQAFDEDEQFSLELVGRDPRSLHIAPEGAPHWPSGITKDRAKVTLDPLEIRLLGGYGAAPSIGLLTPWYALRVGLRKRALIRRLRTVDSNLVEAEKRRDEILAALAKRLRPELEPIETFKRAYATVTEAELQARERGSALQATSSELSAELSRLEGERTRLDVDLSRFNQVLIETRTERETKEARHQRAEARHKRYYIEIRALEQPAGPRGSSPSVLSPEAQKRIQELELEAENGRPELQSAKAALESARAEENAQLAAKHALERTLAAVERSKVAVSERYAKPLTVQNHGVGEAEARLRSALADVGRSVMAARAGVSVEADTVQALREADSQVLVLVTDSERHLRALDAFDAVKVRQGYVWLAAMTLFAVGFAIYAFFF